MVDALARGDVDAINVPQPFHRIAVNTGQARVLGYPFVEVQPGLHIAALGGSATWLDGQPEYGEGVHASHARSIEYLRANPAEAKNLVAEFTKSKRELVEQVPIDDWSTELSIADIAATLKVMQQEGLLKKPIDAEIPGA